MYTFGSNRLNIRVLVMLLASGVTPPLLIGQITDLSVTRAQHERLEVPKDIQRLAVGDGNLLSADLLNNRELLLLGKSSGRTSLLVWFTDGSFREYLITVHRDLSLLQSALALIYPSIRAEIAPDRDAIVLTGTVPDIGYSLRAEQTTHDYLDATPPDGRVVIRDEQAAAAQAGPTPQAAPGPPPAGASTQESTKASITSQSSHTGVQYRSAVINMILLENLPLLPEDRIAREAKSVVGSKITVRRVLKGEVRDDCRDVFLLQGIVPSQVALTRILTLASEITRTQLVSLCRDAQPSGQQGNQQQDIQVVADESGALANAVGAGTGGGGGIGGGGGGIGGGGGGGLGGNLNNQVRKNIARAKVLRAGGGRIISFVEVADIPQVRVDIRLLEINRTKLLNYNPNISTLLGSPKVGPLTASTISQAIQGGGTGTTTGTTTTTGGVPPQNLVGPGNAVQSLLGFLGGTLTAGTQLTTNHFALDAVITFLQQQGIARSLASPSLTVLSGENAQFQVGGDIPVPQTTTTGTSLAVFSSVQFVNYGIQLSVRPLVGDDDVLTLDVAPTISTPDTTLTSSIQSSTGTNQQTIAFQSRSLFTSARLQDGQALLVGGLLSKNTNDTTASTPGLQNVPGLGWLFKNLNRTDDTTELVVVLNPVIVRDPLPNVSLWEYPGSSELMENFAKSAMNFGSGKTSLPAGSPSGKP